MTLFEFNILSDVRKGTHVLTYGTQIAVIDRPKLFRMLYDLELFYAEIVYKPRTSEILAIHGFTDVSLLDDYLENIDISEVLP